MIKKDKKKDQYFQVKCPFCGHINIYEKNIVCKENKVIHMGEEKPNLSDELILPCNNPQCNRSFTHSVNCEGFK